ncbi:hypothetical protein CLU79DRAFT_732903 [Phycomyces nitens]|nr:hypothetical protein CLU79DRAFT_732903 [Phycomyces nitens]
MFSYIHVIFGCTLSICFFLFYFILFLQAGDQATLSLSLFIFINYYILNGRSCMYFLYDFKIIIYI